MPQTHMLGAGLFWHKIRLVKNCPRHHRYATYEYEPPSRVAYSHVFRVFRRFGVVVGRWHSLLDEDVAAMEAVKGRPAKITEEVADRVRHYGWTIRPAGPEFIGYDGDGPEPHTSKMAAVQ